MAIVVITAAVDGADVWASNYVKKQPQQRKNITMPRHPAQDVVAKTFAAAILAAGQTGTLVLNVGHGAADTSLVDGMVDLAPDQAFRIGGMNVANTDVNVFYDAKTTPYSIPQIQLDQATILQNPSDAGALKRLANWGIYTSIGLGVKAASIQKIVFLTCNVGNAVDFVRKIANDWHVVIEAYQRKVALQSQPSGRVRVYLDGDAPGTGTNVPLGEEELPLATEANSIRVGPPL